MQIPEAVPTDSEAQRANFATIADLTMERVRRAGQQQRDQMLGKTMDTGFRVFNLEPSNFPENTFTPDSSKSEADNLRALEEHLNAASQKSIFAEEKSVQ